MKKIRGYWVIILAIFCIGCGGNKKNQDDGQIGIPLPVNTAPVSDDLNIAIDVNTLTRFQLSSTDDDGDELTLSLIHI